MPIVPNERWLGQNKMSGGVSGSDKVVAIVVADDFGKRKGKTGRRRLMASSCLEAVVGQGMNTAGAGLDVVVADGAAPDAPGCRWRAVSVALSLYYLQAVYPLCSLLKDGVVASPEVRERPWTCLKRK